MNKAKFYKVKSFTTPGIVYTVRQMPDGEWRCSCPHFVNNWRRIGECKHIKRLRKRIAYQKKYRKSKAGRATKRGWYDRNIERIREYNREYYLKNKERIRKQRKSKSAST